MRYLKALGVAALALILGGTGKICAAQSAPGGSYQQTCRNIGVRNNTLYADCQDTNNNWQAAQLRDYDRCNGEIQNINGSLQCTGNGNGQGDYGGNSGYGYPNNGYPNNGYPNNGYPNNGYPNGAYGRDRDRDRDYDHDGDRDRDRDRDRANGGWGYGQGGYGRNGMPYGTYSQTCQNIRVNGNRMDASCQKRNGHWNNTHLDNYQQCRNVENDNGKLRCR